jgi:hypothetical protein
MRTRTESPDRTVSSTTIPAPADAWTTMVAGLVFTRVTGIVWIVAAASVTAGIP